MKSRIRELRKTLGMNQTEFGQRIGVKQGSVASYENGAREPLEPVILAICREYNVNEDWLRTGAGEMFQPEDIDTEIVKFIGSINNLPDDDFRKRIMLGFSRMTDQGWKELEEFCKFVCERD